VVEPASRSAGKLNPAVCKSPRHMPGALLFRKDEVSLDEPYAGRQKHTREMVIAALDTGMRRGEVLNQLWEDVDATFIQCS